MRCTALYRGPDNAVTVPAGTTVSVRITLARSRCRNIYSPTIIAIISNLSLTLSGFVADPNGKHIDILVHNPGSTAVTIPANGVVAIAVGSSKYVEMPVESEGLQPTIVKTTTTTTTTTTATA